MRVGIVTCAVKPEPDPDEAPLLEALARRGVSAAAVAWDDDAVAWASFDVCVLRSTWNYIHRLDAFAEWLARAAAATRVLNPPAIVRWNLDKRYLGELAARSVPVPPTVWIDVGEAPDVPRLAAERGWNDIVVKPVVGAASFATQRFAGAALAQASAFVAEHARSRRMMIQPYLYSVEGYGERSVVWIAGAFTHAVRKSARFGGGNEHVSAAQPIADDELALAEAALAPLARDLLYARIDVARDSRGAPIVMELELAEPSLFLVECPAALDRFADAIARLAPGASGVDDAADAGTR